MEKEFKDDTNISNEVRISFNGVEKVLKDVKKNIIALTNVFDGYKINFVDVRKISIAVTMYFDGIEKKSHR